MGQVVLDVSMSLDGFIAGPHVDVRRPLGDGGDRLHEWAFRDAEKQPLVRGGTTFGRHPMLEESFDTTGAVIIGRRTFDVGEGPWGENPPFQVPCFILTHRPREKVVKQGGTTFTFVTDGIRSALEEAKAAAGDKNIALMGANTAQQYMKAGLLDEMQIHIIPVLLGQGIRLFQPLGSEHIELERIRALASPDVTHLRFRVVRPEPPA
jgi:dihydrofolate reductase